jgi:chitinase
VNTYPSAANGLVEENFGNACWGEEYRYEGPGYNGKPPVPGQNLLPTFCPAVQDGIPKCQAMGKKIILSIGGAAPVWNPKTGMTDKTYKGQLKTKEDGEYLATFLWKAYGPYDPSYTGVRPLDRGGDNQTESIKIHIDGFDFDIEDTINGSNKNEGKRVWAELIDEDEANFYR